MLSIAPLLRRGPSEGRVYHGTHPLTGGFGYDPVLPPPAVQRILPELRKPAIASLCGETD